MALRFEWDPAKAESNLRKHGVSFETATIGLSDPFALTEIDHTETSEVRWRTFGHADRNLIVTVIHTSREEAEDGHIVEVIRIISARRADRAERRRYERESREI